MLNLSRIFYEQLRSCTVMLYLGMQFIYVVGHGEQQDFCGNLFVPSEQELAKSIVLFNDSESTFGLNGTIHSQLGLFRYTPVLMHIAISFCSDILFSKRGLCCK